MGENLAVQRAIKQWENPDLSSAERVKVEQYLRETGAEGLWQGGVADEGPRNHQTPLLAESGLSTEETHGIRARKQSKGATKATDQKVYFQSDRSIGPAFDPANANIPVKLGYDENLARSIYRDLPGITYREGWAFNGLAELPPGFSDWRIELREALANTNRINFLVDDMEIFRDPRRFRPSNFDNIFTHWEMDLIIKSGYTDKLHLWQNGEELSPAQRLRWLEQWKDLRGLP
ncbi:hypothetical protein TFLX_05148 [Thermoflexales bacterium]|nr:hypothetical protein TFLX_05148 [Thermoflexales bacterium]